ncbi:MAG: hypothetical protein N2378_12340 [Chloroflexaceae bacterium]|nr:hypothetical protein [Chloroflexaceae bacterium]
MKTRQSWTVGLQISPDLRTALELLAERQRVSDRMRTLAKRLKLMEPKDQYDACDLIRNWAARQILGQFVKEEE